jgi:hypothetical protein
MCCIRIFKRLASVIKLSVFSHMSCRFLECDRKCCFRSFHSFASGSVRPEGVRGEWSALRPYRFTLGEADPGTHCIGGWLAPRAGLVVMEKRKMSCPLPGIEPQLISWLAHGLAAVPTELSWLPDTTVRIWNPTWMQFSYIQKLI